MVRQAHRMIQEQTCIRFQVLEQPPAGPHIAYVKVSSPTLYVSLSVHLTNLITNQKGYVKH